MHNDDKNQHVRTLQPKDDTTDYQKRQRYCTLI